MDLFLDRLPHLKILRAGTVSRRRLDRAIDLSLRILDKVPGVRLTGEQKKRLSGYLFWEGEALVLEVARGLAENRDAFPDIPYDPAEMREGLRRAGGWLSLRTFAGMLYDLADDNFTLERSTVVSRALSTLRSVRADRERLVPGPRDGERFRAMAAAEDTLRSYRLRVQRKKDGYTQREQREMERLERRLNSARRS